MNKIIFALALTLTTQAAMAAPCTKPEKAAMKKAVYAGMTEVIHISNTELEAIDDLRQDYLMTNQNITAVVEFAARRLNKEPTSKPAASYMKVADLWSAFCSPY